MKSKLPRAKAEAVVSQISARHAVTARQVAAEAGVSQSAVSRVFTPGASVAAQTRSRVEAIARRLGYRPNFIARSLITRRSRIIGVAVPGTSNPFYQAAVDALSVAFGKAGQRLLLFNTDPSGATDPIIEDVLSYRVDALVLISTSLSSQFAEECRQMRLPVVMLNRKTDTHLVSSVVGSNHEGTRLIAAFLLAAGHKRFAYVAGLAQSSTSRDREQAFQGYLLAHGVRSVQRGEGNYTYAGAAAATREFLSSRTPPDAIFCANDYMALAAINVARTEFQKEVGRQISIVGFDNIDLAQWPLFALTTFSQPLAAMVEEVVRLIDRQLTTPDAAPTACIVPGELFVRDSARKPKAGLVRVGEQWTWSPGKHG